MYGLERLRNMEHSSLLLEESQSKAPSPDERIIGMWPNLVTGKKPDSDAVSCAIVRMMSDLTEPILGVRHRRQYGFLEMNALKDQFISSQAFRTKRS
jgi:hypothetical protein